MAVPGVDRTHLEASVLVLIPVLLPSKIRHPRFASPILIKPLQKLNFHHLVLQKDSGNAFSNNRRTGFKKPTKNDSNATKAEHVQTMKNCIDGQTASSNIGYFPESCNFIFIEIHSSAIIIWLVHYVCNANVAFRRMLEIRFPNPLVIAWGSPQNTFLLPALVASARSLLMELGGRSSPSSRSWKTTSQRLKPSRMKARYLTGNLQNNLCALNSH